MQLALIRVINLHEKKPSNNLFAVRFANLHYYYVIGIAVCIVELIFWQDKRRKSHL